MKLFFCGQWSWVCMHFRLYLALCCSQPDSEQHWVTSSLQFGALECLLCHFSRVYSYFCHAWRKSVFPQHFSLCGSGHREFPRSDLWSRTCIYIPSWTSFNIKEFLGLWNVVFGTVHFRVDITACLIYQCVLYVNSGAVTFSWWSITDSFKSAVNEGQKHKLKAFEVQLMKEAHSCLPFWENVNCSGAL